MSGVSKPSIEIVEYWLPIFLIVRYLNELPPLISMFFGPLRLSDSINMLSAEVLLIEMEEKRRLVAPENMLMSPFTEALVRDVKLSFVEIDKSCFISMFSILVVPSVGEIGLFISILLNELSLILIFWKRESEIVTTVFLFSFPILLSERVPKRFTLLDVIERRDK